MQDIECLCKKGTLYASLNGIIQNLNCFLLNTVTAHKMRSVFLYLTFVIMCKYAK